MLRPRPSQSGRWRGQLKAQRASADSLDGRGRFRLRLFVAFVGLSVRSNLHDLGQRWVQAVHLQLIEQILLDQFHVPKEAAVGAGAGAERHPVGAGLPRCRPQGGPPPSAHHIIMVSMTIS